MQSHTLAMLVVMTVNTTRKIRKMKFSPQGETVEHRWDHLERMKKHRKTEILAGYIYARPPDQGPFKCLN